MNSVSMRIGLSAEDLKRVRQKLEETSTVKMELQLKLDELQSSELSIQVKTHISTYPFTQHSVLFQIFEEVV